MTLPSGTVVDIRRILRDRRGNRQVLRQDEIGDEWLQDRVIQVCIR